MNAKCKIKKNKKCNIHIIICHRPANRYTESPNKPLKSEGYRNIVKEI